MQLELMTSSFVNFCRIILNTVKRIRIFEVPLLLWFGFSLALVPRQNPPAELFREAVPAVVANS